MVCCEEDVLHFSELIFIIKLIFVSACHFAQVSFVGYLGGGAGFLKCLYFKT
jgi:hypothetical protein